MWQEGDIRWNTPKRTRQIEKKKKKRYSHADGHCQTLRKETNSEQINGPKEEQKQFSIQLVQWTKAVSVDAIEIIGHRVLVILIGKNNPLAKENKRWRCDKDNRSDEGDSNRLLLAHEEERSQKQENEENTVLSYLVCSFIRAHLVIVLYKRRDRNRKHRQILKKRREPKVICWPCYSRISHSNVKEKWWRWWWRFERETEAPISNL